jgi:hypothetical protein
MGKVQALMSQLDKMEVVALSDGGCNTTLLGTGWYILEYTGRSANIVGFNEFIARKTGLPIVAGITKVTLPNRKGCILLRSHNGYTIPLELPSALMTMHIAMPTEHDLASLPIVNITSAGLWVPSNHNKTDFGFSFADTDFEFTQNAQTSTTDPLEHETFFDSQSTHTKDQPVTKDDNTIFHDTCDDMDTKAFHLSIDYDKIIDSATVDSFLGQLNYAELRGDHEEFDTFAYASCAAIQDQAEQYVEYLGYRPIDVVSKTLERTSQLATTILQFPMQRHIKSRFPHLNRN